jgi:hypothetical protein
MKDLKYQYRLYAWGGFYNKEFKNKHKEEPGEYLFDTEQERREYLNKLKKIENKLNARFLVVDLSEGYNVIIPTVAHRVIEYNKERYYSTYKFDIKVSFDVAKYHIEYKWYPGFNDYPLGKNFDYSKIKIIQEWITGTENL